MTPYPAIYCPAGMPAPACCPHAGAMQTMLGKGADADDGTGPGAGMCYGMPYASEGWQRTAAGWYLRLNEAHVPQHLVKLQPDPRIVRWRSVAGAKYGHWWQVPVILCQADDDPTRGYISALDRLWMGSEWGLPPDLQCLQVPLLAIVGGQLLDLDPEQRNTRMRNLAIELLKVGNWIDEDFLAVTGWFSEAMMLRIILAGCDRDEALAVAEA